MSNPTKPSAQARKQAHKRAIANKQVESSKQGTKGVRAPLVFFYTRLRFRGKVPKWTGDRVSGDGQRCWTARTPERTCESRPDGDD